LRQASTTHVMICVGAAPSALFARTYHFHACPFFV
jgi:hypothetical protein